MQTVDLQSPFFASLNPLIKHVFGSHAEATAYKLLAQQNDYCVLSAQIHSLDSEVIIKLDSRDITSSASFERTAVIHRLLRHETDVPVSEIIAVDTQRQTFPWRYLIQTRMQGELWADVVKKMDGDAKRLAYRQMGNVVAQIHSVKFPNFGDIGVDSEFSFEEALIQRARKAIQQERLRERFTELVSHRRTLFETITQPNLCHDDLHHYNLLFDNVQGTWLLSGVLDFDKAWSGHFETDLARLDFWDHMMGNGFREAYVAIHPISPEYELRRPIYQLMWCLEYAQKTPRHVVDLQHLCEALNIQSIEL